MIFDLASPCARPYVSTAAPFRPAVTDTTQSQAVIEEKAGPRKGTVLIVDDKTENLDAFEAILEPLGHPVVRAST
ncbi:MAG TPA: hypothetical protein VHM30_15110, partial [Gemmatimonadaceae bacterium]|nr:hypothetical protein [Gemmatimonadaceae bacterium]